MTFVAKFVCFLTVIMIANCKTLIIGLSMSGIARERDEYDKVNRVWDGDLDLII